MENKFDRLVEEVSASVHEAWMGTKRSKGVTSRLSEGGEELMVPYANLSEDAKDLDRNSVRTVLEVVLTIANLSDYLE